MIGLDTNVLVRHLTGDDPVQTPKARALLAARCTVDDPGYVNRIVLCELVWVLARGYRYDRRTIAGALEQLLNAAELLIEDRDTAVDALAAYRGSQADFADCLMGILNRVAGCDRTATFDRDAASLPDFMPV
ncbi:MAG TPA: type II toxin-antitoxin system VapC family toxin [Methylomirabilota bacterium]|nr:type II toxin-antitoxin system VapC family toxin [Methylomirabilota bacterium]